MVTITETSKRTLSSPDEIAGYLAQKFADMSGSSAFEQGEIVAITNRAGLPSDFGVGDVAVMLLDLPGGWSHVLLLNGNGAEIVVQVASAHLAKRGAAETAGA